MIGATTEEIAGLLAEQLKVEQTRKKIAGRLKEIAIRNAGELIDRGLLHVSWNRRRIQEQAGIIGK